MTDGKFLRHAAPTEHDTYCNFCGLDAKFWPAVPECPGEGRSPGHPKVSVKVVGNYIVERDGPGFLVMFPTGNVAGFAGLDDVYRAIHLDFAKQISATDIGISQIISYDGSTEAMACKGGYVSRL